MPLPFIFNCIYYAVGREKCKATDCVLKGISENRA